MKYRPNQPKKDFAKSLYLSKETEKRLQNAVIKAFDQVSGNGNPDFNIDEVNALIAPYIKTPEEAYFCGQMVVISVMEAQQNYNNPNIN